MIKIPQQVINEQKSYREKVEDLKSGRMEPERFKPYRVSMGIYEQRDKDNYMVRTRIPCGVVNLAQLQKISELAKAYSHGYVHFTTRQDIQFHKVTLENTAEIIERLLEVDIITKGTGGNTARNVASSPLSGVSADDVFDVTPYALATTSFALQNPSIFNLPRKYKIAFANSPIDTANATISDLGFIAKIQEGQKGFELYGAGGLGGSPNVSVKLADFIPAAEVLYHVQAMKELFENEGDRANKNKARIRYILQRLGAEEFKALYHKTLEKVKSAGNLDLSFNEETKVYNNGNIISNDNPLIFAQKQQGFYSLYVHPQNGNLSAENLDRVLNFITGLNYEPTLRLANTQGFFVRDLKGSDAEGLADIVSEFTSTYPIDNSVACAGASTCQLGLCLSQNLMSAIRKRFSEAEQGIKAQLPRIFISGCPNSCGQHHRGDIGLYGRAKRAADGLVPMYSILFGGAVGAGKAVLGTEYGAIPAKSIPEFFYQLAVLKSKSGISDFVEFINKNNAEIKSLVNSFANIESEAQNADLYYDFGATEKFSLKGRGPGECSAGVLDVIKLDISNARLHLQEYSDTRDSGKLYDASLSAARALLILKGVDTTKDRVIFQEFINHFITTGYVNEDVKGLFDSLFDYKIGDLKSLDNQFAKVNYLVNKVIAMYDSLNPRLEITLEKEQQAAAVSDDVLPGAGVAMKTVNLKGVKCPINFVKVKIELEKINSGDTIAFQLDDGDPIKNVPKSAEVEGHEIVKIDDSFDGYNLLVIRKK